METERIPSQKTGYLTTDFRLFYLTTREQREFQSHYHDFHKLLVFFRGNVSYRIEGEAYELLPWDMVLVSAGEVHRPVIHSQAPYERLIAYLSPAFFDRYVLEEGDLFSCFQECRLRKTHVIRLRSPEKAGLLSVFTRLAAAAAEESFASSLLRRALLVELLILLNRNLLLERPAFPSSSSHPLVQKALSYMHQNLQQPLSVEEIAAACYVNRSYLMHLFRRETGVTLVGYLTEKRLFSARSMIREGVPVTEACLRSGFSSYDSFYRAYKKKFGNPPKDSRKETLCSSE